MTVCFPSGFRAYAGATLLAACSLALTSPVESQTYIGVTAGLSLADKSFHRNEITDEFGNTVYVNYDGNFAKYGHFGVLLQVGKGHLALRGGVAYTRAGQVDVLGRGFQAICVDSSLHSVPCPADSLLPKSVVHLLIGTGDILIRPWSPNDDRVVIPYFLLGPEVRYRLHDSGTPKKYESELSTFLLAFGVGAGLQFDLRGVDWPSGASSHWLSMLIEGRYSLSVEPILGSKSISFAGQQIRIGEPYTQSRWLARIGFLVNLHPHADESD